MAYYKRYRYGTYEYYRWLRKRRGRWGKKIKFKDKKPRWKKIWDRYPDGNAEAVKAILEGLFHGKTIPQWARDNLRIYNPAALNEFVNKYAPEFRRATRKVYRPAYNKYKRFVNRNWANILFGGYDDDWRTPWSVSNLAYDYLYPYQNRSSYYTNPKRGSYYGSLIR